jgi:hypothetical protein
MFPAERPRLTPRVRVGLVVFDEVARAAVLAGLQNDPHVEDVLVFDDPHALPSEERSLCTSAATCAGRHPTVCAWARVNHLDDVVLATFRTREHEKRGPGQPTGPISLDPHVGSTSPGPLLSYDAIAKLSVEVMDTPSCDTARGLGRDLSSSTSVLPAKGGGPELAKRQLLDAIPRALADTFPAQTTLDQAGRVHPAPADAPSPDGMYAVYRDDRLQGIVRADGVGTDDARLAPLTCCFGPRPGDVLVQHRRELVLELAASFTLAPIAWDGKNHAGPGAGARVRIGALDRGWQGGVAFDLLYPRGASAFLATAEVGYHWRPTPALLVGVLGGGGGGFASTSATDSAPHTDASGPHALGAAIVSWHATKDVFVALDAAYIYSASFSARAGSLNPNFTFRGPLVRLAVGLH